MKFVVVTVQEEFTKGFFLSHCTNRAELRPHSDTAQTLYLWATSDDNFEL